LWIFFSDAKGDKALMEACTLTFITAVMNAVAWVLSRGNYWGLGNELSQSGALTANSFFQISLLVFLYGFYRLYLPNFRKFIGERLKQIKKDTIDKDLFPKEE
jgi:hypothetical protein